MHHESKKQYLVNISYNLFFGCQSSIYIPHTDRLKGIFFGIHFSKRNFLCEKTTGSFQRMTNLLNRLFFSNKFNVILPIIIIKLLIKRKAKDKKSRKAEKTPLPLWKNALQFDWFLRYILLAFNHYSFLLIPLL